MSLPIVGLIFLSRFLGGCHTCSLTVGLVTNGQCDDEGSGLTPEFLPNRHCLRKTIASSKVVKPRQKPPDSADI